LGVERDVTEVSSEYQDNQPSNRANNIQSMRRTFSNQTSNNNHPTIFLKNSRKRVHDLVLRSDAKYLVTLIELEAKVIVNFYSDENFLFIVCILV
jgi:hypothetical protein